MSERDADDPPIRSGPARKPRRSISSTNIWAGRPAPGLIPVPLLDLAAISLVELKMIHSLANLYGVPFSRGAAKSIIGALIGGGGTYVIGGAGRRAW